MKIEGIDVDNLYKAEYFQKAIAAGTISAEDAIKNLQKFQEKNVNTTVNYDAIVKKIENLISKRAESIARIEKINEAKGFMSNMQVGLGYRGHPARLVLDKTAMPAIENALNIERNNLEAYVEIVNKKLEMIANFWEV